MSDNYYRLVTFICNFCKDVMRNVFLHFAKADCHENDMCFTNLESYLHNRMSDIMIMKTNGCLRLDQVNRILTNNGETDIKLWDISMLTAAIENLFGSRLNMRVRNSIQQIRQIRNLLIHIAHVDQITDDQFNHFWFTLRKATLKLASNIQGTKYEEDIAAKIDDAKKHRAYESFDTLREWFEETVTQLKDEFKNMRSEICSIRNDNSSVRYQAEDVNAEKNKNRARRKRFRTETVYERASLSTLEADRMKDESFEIMEDVHVNARTINQKEWRKRLRMKKTVSERASSSALDANMLLYRRSDGRVEDPLALQKTECANALQSKELTPDETELKNIGLERHLVGLERHLVKVETEEVAPEIRLLSEVSYLSGSLGQLKSQWENVRTVEDVQALISDGQVPNERVLSDVVHRLGRKSDIVELLCKTICEKIASASPKVVHVFAAYTLANRDKLHFVVLLENGSSSDKDFNLDHEIVVRNCKGNGKTEHEHMQKETESELSAEESTALKNTINEITKQYMEDHKYLSAITARKISLEGKETICIVMYAHPCTDRYSDIPHSEEHLPATIEGYKVVVRNGVFKQATKTASECHDNVRMGCQITSNLVSGFGTLGGFVDHHAYGLCGFTCAHVVYGTEQMKFLKRKKTT
ncbi:uncharacterized protein LOC123556855 [Mercenaria mercenaria]|uniref:uncharacterized protein LOC123556855 n=1 Tax=Mercenaria mercenaria TaxID=6596 RepID=UPI00234F2211|nr:uncharacterized protein LOC123556855 [Mercenaria mercenaria]XP_053381445.1 uncharacterized protein LOC123556855 [Mercenaria mercenaria]XP_053381446.1 uncharacterized protein LOC123556855 [Mercenaria mercenaria]